MLNTPFDVANSIRDLIDRLRERAFTPAFILLGEKSYTLLCHHTQFFVQDLGEGEECLVTKFDDIPVVLCHDLPEFYVKVLTDAPASLLYHQRQ